MKTSTLVAFAVAAASLVSSTTHAAPLQLVVKNTDPTGIAGGATWATSNPFLNPSIDNSGNVAFRATLQTGVGGVVSTDNTTAWYGAPGSLTLFARTGNPGPGLPGVNITAINPASFGLSPNGTLQFAGSTAAPNGYVATGTVSGGFSKVARNGEVLPGVGGVAISGSPASLAYHFVNNAGQTLAFASLASTPASSGLWVGNGANLQLAYQTGQSYAGLPAGGTPNGVSVAMINGSGSLYVSFLMTNAGAINSTNNEALTTLPFGSSTFTVIAREGDVAPGGGGATYIDVGPVPPNPEFSTFTATNGNYNNLGHSLFSVGLEGTGVTTSNDAALYYYDGTAVQLLRRRGDLTTAVGGASLALNSGVAFNARLNNNDNVAWSTALTTGVGGVTSSNDAVLLYTQLGSSSDTLVAREGSAVPVVAGALFGTSFSNLLQNNANQLVFSTTLLDDPNNANDNVTISNDLALFSWDPVSGYSLIAREGDNLSSIGINMTLTGINIFNTANTEGGAYALTDNGWFTFRAAGTALSGFTDNAAIVRTQITQIPEPGTLAMLAAAGAGALALCRRRAV
jgi:hypothetical protein